MRQRLSDRNRQRGPGRTSNGYRCDLRYTRRDDRRGIPRSAASSLYVPRFCRGRCGAAPSALLSFSSFISPPKKTKKKKNKILIKLNLKQKTKNEKQKKKFYFSRNSSFSASSSNFWSCWISPTVLSFSLLLFSL